MRLMAHPTDAQVASVPLFSRMSPEDRALVAAAAEVRHYRKDEAVFAEGEPSSAILMIISGRIHLTGSRSSSTVPETIAAGDPVGDILAYEGGPFPATGVAMEPTDCLIIPRADFFRLLEESPSLVRSLVHSLTHRIVELATALRKRS
jgi:CRP/FNR family transcriptional regulator